MKQLRALEVNYEEGHDDPQADIRYRDVYSKTAGEVFTEKQLGFVKGQLRRGEVPKKFYVSRIDLGACYSLEIALELEIDGGRQYKELFFSKKTIDPKRAKLYWEDGKDLRLTLEDYYNRWLNDPWR